MQLKRISSGRLRGIGHDEKSRHLCVEFDNGELLEYDGITLEMWRRFSSSASPWSYYCDNIRDELTPRILTKKPHQADASVSSKTKNNPLDDLFK
jgi:hypothetical protein